MEETKEPRSYLSNLLETLVEMNNYADFANKFVKENGIYYTKEKIWWWWDKKQYCWEMVDEIDVMNIVDQAINNQPKTIQQNVKNQILEALKRKSRLNKPKEPKKTWIQFKNKIADLEEKKTFEATKEYFFVNPIPWNLGETFDTPEIDKLFEEWVGEKNVLNLHEIIAFCLSPEYFIKELFVLIGSGNNGKSKYVNIIEKLLGPRNCCSTDLDLITKNSFETSKIYKKLIATMGETNFNTLKNTSLLKRLTGSDTIGAQFKNKDSFDYINYAKLIICTNSLPKTEDRTKGFYSRWRIIDFPNEFDNKQDVLSRIPEQEYENLSFKCLNLLRGLRKRREFLDNQTNEHKERKYEEKSNPLKKFLKENFIEDPDGEVPFFRFYDGFCLYLKESGFRVQDKKEVSRQLLDENFNKTYKNVDVTQFDGGIKRTKWLYVEGIRPKRNLEKYYLEKF